MNLEKLVNEIIYNLKPIYKEFGFDRNEIDVEIVDMDEGDDYDDELAWINTIIFTMGYSYDDLLECKKKGITDIKLDIDYSKTIYISEDVLYDEVDSKMQSIQSEDSEMYDNILISLVEDAITHQLRRLYQLKTLQSVSLQYVDIVDTSEESRYGLEFDDKINTLFELDAINYTHYKRDVTILKDVKVKHYISDINYGASLLNLQEYEEDVMMDLRRSINDLRQYIAIHAYKQKMPKLPKEEKCIYKESELNRILPKTEKDDDEDADEMTTGIIRNIIKEFSKRYMNYAK